MRGTRCGMRDVRSILKNKNAFIASDEAFCVPPFRGVSCSWVSDSKNTQVGYNSAAYYIWIYSK